MEKVHGLFQGDFFYQSEQINLHMSPLIKFDAHCDDIFMVGGEERESLG